MEKKYYIMFKNSGLYQITEEEYNLMPLTDRKDVRINLDEQIDEETHRKLISDFISKVGM